MAAEGEQLLGSPQWTLSTSSLDNDGSHNAASYLRWPSGEIAYLIVPWNTLVQKYNQVLLSGGIRSSFLKEYFEFAGMVNPNVDITVLPNFRS